MTSENLTRVCSAITERWKAGNHWPPDFAEFMVLVAECTGGVLGLSVDDVLAENKRWRNEFYQYNSTEAFPWKHPVLYQICIVLKRKGIDFKLTEKELRELAGKELAYWEKRAETHRFFASFCAWLLIVASASVTIRILTGDYHYANWSETLINLAFCVAVIASRGNVMRLAKPTQR
ncbi:replication protein P [Serratia liquefaciens]|uniref:replication protein P n=1 Tax=Serratia liquefaciens TaxID=614 RepID=UPI002157A26E|nr:replication protein P [Serratia liquefaciens]